MLRVALTGGIATGKTFCLDRFAALGVPVIDADLLSRDAVAPGTPGLASIRERFGTCVIASDGSLDRPALAAIVFADQMARADLESIIHPEVYRRIDDWFEHQPSETRLAMAEIPLLFETGHERDFDQVVACVCDPLEQLRRVMHRDQLSEEAAKARLAAQWPIGEKAARADHVIRTDGSVAETEEQVRRVWEGLKRQKAEGRRQKTKR